MTFTANVKHVLNDVPQDPGKPPLFSLFIFEMSWLSNDHIRLATCFLIFYSCLNGLISRRGQFCNVIVICLQKCWKKCPLQPTVAESWSMSGHLHAKESRYLYSPAQQTRKGQWTFRNDGFDVCRDNRTILILEWRQPSRLSPALTITSSAIKQLVNKMQQATINMADCNRFPSHCRRLRHGKC